MFTFALGFFAGHQYFSLYFQPLSAFRRKRKKEFGRKRPEGKTLITTTTCVRRTPCRVSNWSLSLLCSIVFIFSERKCISKSWGKLMNYKPDNRIPSLFTDFDNIKDFPWLFKKFTDFSLTLNKFSFFPDFSLTLKTFRLSLTFPDCGNPVYSQLSLQHTPLGPVLSVRLSSKMRSPRRTRSSPY